MGLVIFATLSFQLLLTSSPLKIVNGLWALKSGKTVVELNLEPTFGCKLEEILNSGMRYLLISLGLLISITRLPAKLKIRSISS